MNSKKIFDAVGELDVRYIEEALSYKKRTSVNRWIKRGMTAACLCLIAAGGIWLSRLAEQRISNAPVQEEAYGFALEGNDILYFPISFSQRKAYGLVDRNATGLTEENTYRITEDDLGGVMGTVGESREKSLIGEKVYYFAGFPSDDTICIVKINGEYQFYVKEGTAEQQICADPSAIADEPADGSSSYSVPEDFSGENKETQTGEEQITFAYITQLQDEISTAMSRGDLPFVSSSAVYENPYRLYIIVTSNEQEDLRKLKSFDTVGGAMEIVYAPGSVSTEDAERQE